MISLVNNKFINFNRKVKITRKKIKIINKQPSEDDHKHEYHETNDRLDKAIKDAFKICSTKTEKSCIIAWNIVEDLTNATAEKKKILHDFKLENKIHDEDIYYDELYYDFDDI